MDLLLSLGHNASAILMHNGTVLFGYEEERLNRVKSASTFPENAIRRVIADFEKAGHASNGGDLHVSHWFDDMDLGNSGFSDKHWNLSFVNDLCSKWKLKLNTHTKDFTHHDAHAWSAVAFAENHGLALNRYHVCIADGFGNKEEVFSVYVYHASTDSLQLVERKYGYKYSLGLLYQYATSYCGMRENQDEYKFLGYESSFNPKHVRQATLLREEACALANIYATSNDGPSANSVYVDVASLVQTKQNVHSRLDNLLRRVFGANKHDMSQEELRQIIGFFIQAVIEEFYTIVIENHEIEDIVVAGGVHYNVKLNNHILRSVQGGVCVNPLAGDQGAAIGLARSKRSSVHGLKDLYWGKRDLSVPEALNGQAFDEESFYFTNEDDYVDFVSTKLLEGRIVNTINGSMEFGPRALCHTSTLANPRISNVSDINQLNGRDTVMPMAPVMLAENAEKFFGMNDVARVFGSLEYMVITLDYHNTIDVERFRGVMHPYPAFDTRKGFSGRPQLVDDSSHSPIKKILKDLESTTPALINTSFNVHGVPIVYSLKDAISDMKYNMSVANEYCCPVPLLAIGNF
jgi:predicted NodU family carbamoyl transferase